MRVRSLAPGFRPFLRAGYGFWIPAFAGMTFLALPAARATELFTPKVAALGGAMTAVADDNSAVTSNPGGMSQSKRYAAAFTFNLTPDIEREFIGTVIDTSTQPVGVGLAYMRRMDLEKSPRPDRDLHRGHLALSYPLPGGLHVGAGAKYFYETDLADDGFSTKKTDGIGADAGLLWAPFSWGSLGIAGINLAEVPAIVPEGRRAMAAGLAFKVMTYALLTGEVHEVPFEKEISEWRTGLQVTLGGQIDLRGGYRTVIGSDDAPDQRMIGGGISWNAPKVTMAWGVQRGIDEPKVLTHSLMLDLHFGESDTESSSRGRISPALPKNE